MIYIDVVVNVPIGRQFARTRVQPADTPGTWQPDLLSSAAVDVQTAPDHETEYAEDAEGADTYDVAEGSTAESTEEAADGSAPAPFRVFTYHLPVELEDVVVPGHLLWVPFGKRMIQGIAVRFVENTTVRTKAVDRLARPEPVLSPQQIALAAWIAHDYVAPIAESVRLLLPPRLLQRSPESLGIHARRQLQVALIAGAAEIEPLLASMGSNRHAARVLDWFLAHPGASISPADLRKELDLKSDEPLRALLAAGWIAGEDTLALVLDPARARREMEDLRGITRYRLVVDALSAAGAPMWRDDLNARAPATLPQLRAMREAGLISLEEHIRFRDPLQGRTFTRSYAPPLTTEQMSAWRQIAAEGFAQSSNGQEHGQEHGQGESKEKRFLLHGVTGSGKTEIYLRSIAETLAQGRQAIVLVPEIALTPQTVARFSARFPGRVTVIHSGLNAGERYDVWRAIREGSYDIVVGPRSALFAPMPRLGLIVIDEEHENSYKQEAEEWGSLTVFYDARRVARRLAELTGSVLISGSATPSMEIYSEAMRGEVTLIRMNQRVEGHGLPTAPAADGAHSDEGTPTVYASMPPVEVVDMRQELRAQNRSIFSRSLQAQLQETLAAGEQAILFLNRRGTHTFIMCRDCGHVQQCVNCEIPLVYHVATQDLVCHHCGTSYPIPLVCPVCNSTRIRYFGSGTEHIEDRVSEVVPRARLLRWDKDTTTQRGSHEVILQRFANHEADILIGTQMIAKGLDLPLVTLVGVISADVGLHLPDFRAAERSFQLLTQVAGRAGRSRRGGRVVIQTYTPEHYAIQAAAQHDYEAFYRREITFRAEQGYPPMQRMARLVLWEKDLAKAAATAKDMAGEIKQRIAEMGLGEESRLIGPAPAFFARTRGFYRWQILLLAPDPAAVVRELDIPFGWRVDIDPGSIL